MSGTLDHRWNVLALLPLVYIASVYLIVFVEGAGWVDFGRHERVVSAIYGPIVWYREHPELPGSNQFERSVYAAHSFGESLRRT